MITRLPSIFGFGLAVFVGLSAMASGVRVGNELFVPARESSKSFVQCPAVATKTSSGVEIRFYGNAVLTATERVASTEGVNIAAVIGDNRTIGAGDLGDGQRLKIIIRRPHHRRHEV